MDDQKIDEILDVMKARFTSANAIPVSRAHINHGEWLCVLATLDEREREIERLRALVDDLWGICEAYRDEVYGFSGNDDWRDQRLNEVDTLLSRIEAAIGGAETREGER